MFASAIMDKPTQKAERLQEKRDRLRDQLEQASAHLSGVQHRESTRRLMLELNRAELMLQASARKATPQASAKAAPAGGDEA
ncbi:MAG: hypothetical protein GC160_14920 [Acidobacteria bacterium]|nr:hypothetical protein [Acidobacteriota bacterium]